MLTNPGLHLAVTYKIAISYLAYLLSVEISGRIFKVKHEYNWEGDRDGGKITKWNIEKRKKKTEINTAKDRLAGRLEEEKKKISG